MIFFLVLVTTHTHRVSYAHISLTMFSSGLLVSMYS
jgi:hypothetical protein